MTNKAFTISVGMSVEEGVKKAIEGGYQRIDPNITITETKDATYFSGVIEVALLDPLFWIALGKSLEWNVEWREWLYRQHQFIDTLASLAEDETR